MLYKIGEAVLVNKWSYSLSPLDSYLPEQYVFPKQLNLLGEYSLLGIVLEVQQEMCLVWIPAHEKKFYFKLEDIKKCQD